MSVSDWNQLGRDGRDEIERGQILRWYVRGMTVERLAEKVGISLVRLDYLIGTSAEFLRQFCSMVGIDPALEALRLGVELPEEEDDDGEKSL